ncbi:MAG: hypothetical protein LUH57_03695 [Ruminococcus sp.]|nr:hypothetical protein [Ruminococcus sp.]
MKSTLKTIIIGVVCGILCNLAILVYNEDFTFSDIILRFSQSQYGLENTNLVVLVQWNFPLLLFQAIYGTHIYKHFCNASVYFFSRTNNKVKWFLKETLLLIPQIFVFLLSELLAGTALAMITNNVIFDKTSIILLVYYLAITSLWLFLTSMLVNIISIKFTSSVGYGVVAGIELACMALFFTIRNKMFELGESRSIYDVDLVAKNPVLIKIDPLAHLNLSWHTSKIESVNKLISRYIGIDFDLNFSVVLFAAISVVVVIIGCIVAKNVEFIATNRETGGN